MDIWRSRDQTAYDAIVQSVLASSAIEGEKVFVEQAEVQATVETELREGTVNEDWKKRRLIGGDIYDTYIHALNHRGDPILSVPFIQDLHKRMFTRIYPDSAGQLKDEPVCIVGGGYNIETVPVDRTPALFESIVSELNHRWGMAIRHAEYSLFLSIAEFVVDFLAIHPFADGNGRTARLLSTYLLERAGYHFARFYSLDNIIHETKGRYYHALFTSQKNWFTTEEDLTAWVDYYIDIVYIQYRRAFETLREEAIKRNRPSA